jgi:hypothetical protein
MDNLQGAYLSVYEANNSYLETDMKKRAENNKKALEDMEKTDAHKDMVTTVRKKFDEETDLFDYLLEYLVAEGYADTNAAAIAIMSNMSEEWKQSIVEETKRTEYLQKKFDAENKAKSGSAHTYIPGKQNTGSALYKARQSERQMKGDK